MIKPDDVFDREQEWRALDAFVSSSRPGASLGLVYGRRRQGKTYLLQAMTEAVGGFYVAALNQSREQNLQRLAEAYREFVGGRAPVAFGSWEQAFEALLALGHDAERPVPVVVDEFPYLLGTAPELPSVVQALLSPRGPAASWPTRLILCGSALSTMRGLLAGSAPLRGRAVLELVLRSFDVRDSARYWGVDHDPDVALRLHALVGGTPAYLDMSGGSGPAAAAEFDDWVASTLLNPASAMFREGDVLLSEEEVTDPAIYYSVLTAISQGRCRRSDIAAAIGRPQTAVAHPLEMLIRTGLVERHDDALRDRRATFHVAEPILRLHQLVVAPNESRLIRHRGAQVWSTVADTVSSNIYGPHFESVARSWCLDHASPRTVGGIPSRVSSSEVSCREHRSTHEVDVVTVETVAGRPDRVTAIGEAKWRTRPVAGDQLRRLDHLRDVLELPEGTRLLLFSRSGFTPDLTGEARRRDDVELVDLHRLYEGD